MMRLTETAVAEIRACQGVYRQSDVARNYGVHHSTINLIWRQKRRQGIEPATEAPNIEAQKAAEYVKDDVLTLANRGMSKDAIAAELGVSLATVYRCFPRWLF